MLHSVFRLSRPGSFRLVLTLATLVGLPGCAAVHRPPTTITALLADADTACLAERRLRDTVWSSSVRAEPMKR